MTIEIVRLIVLPLDLCRRPPTLTLLTKTNDNNISPTDAPYAYAYDHHPMDMATILESLSSLLNTTTVTHDGSRCTVHHNLVTFQHFPGPKY